MPGGIPVVPETAHEGASSSLRSDRRESELLPAQPPPDLLCAIKQAVDEHATPGRFLLGPRCKCGQLAVQMRGMSPADAESRGCKCGASAGPHGQALLTSTAAPAPRRGCSKRLGGVGRGEASVARRSSVAQLADLDARAKRNNRPALFGRVVPQQHSAQLRRGWGLQCPDCGDRRRDGLSKGCAIASPKNGRSSSALLTSIRARRSRGPSGRGVS